VSEPWPAPSSCPAGMDSGYDGGRAALPAPAQLPGVEGSLGGRARSAGERPGRGQGQRRPSRRPGGVPLLRPGNCSRGESCNFLHPRDSAPRGPPPPPRCAATFWWADALAGGLPLPTPSGRSRAHGWRRAGAALWREPPGVPRTSWLGGARARDLPLPPPGTGGQQAQQPQPQQAHRAGNGAQPDLRQVLSGGAAGGRSNVRRSPWTAKGGTCRNGAANGGTRAGGGRARGAAVPGQPRARRN